MEYKDYYQILGVNRDANQDEVKRAYRKLARKYHPDVSQASDAEARFKEVGEAYEVLKDPEKRAAYDQLGANWKQGEAFRPPPGWDAGFEFRGGGFSARDGAAFSDFFESLFGQHGGWQHESPGSAFHQHQGEDRHAKIMIDLEDSYLGAQKMMALHVPEHGPDGRVRQREHRLRVSIPKGIRAGQRIRLAGQGDAGLSGGHHGDLYLEVAFNPHPWYRVEDRDVYLDLPVSPWEAALGATVSTPTPAGSIDLKIPSGSSSGRKLRMRGRGLPGKTPGDFYAVLNVAVPAAESEEAKALYQQMARMFDFNPRRNLEV